MATGTTTGPASRLARAISGRPPRSGQLAALIGYPVTMGRPPKYGMATWIVTDDWPDPAPVTTAEIELFERWFGDLFDKMFGPDA